jgi:hypothetical protein
VGNGEMVIIIDECVGRQEERVINGEWSTRRRGRVFSYMCFVPKIVVYDFASKKGGKQLCGRHSTYISFHLHQKSSSF